MPTKSPRRVVEIHGFALRMAREMRGKKVADLASDLDVSRSYLAHIENGTKRRVSVEFYNAVLTELNIDDYRALLAEAPPRLKHGGFASLDDLAMSA